MTSTKHLTAHNLGKKYGAVEVVRDVSLHVESGTIVGLLGPNGAGKTTCFYMIVGLVKPSSGKVTLDDLDLTALPIHKRAGLGIGYLPQEVSVFRNLSTFDNILAVIEMRKDIPKSERENVAMALLNEFNLVHVKDRPGNYLSGGEKRRTEIARVIANDPSFILLDEPFSGVDPISINEIKEIVETLAKRGVGILITDHNVRETLSICDHAYIVKSGQVMVSGKPDEVLQDEQAREAYLGEQFQM